MEYLGYILKRTGIKSKTKKVQVIIAITLAKQVKDLHRFTGMVQYCRYLWARHGEMLAQLTFLVRECDHTNQSQEDQEKGMALG